VTLPDTRVGEKEGHPGGGTASGSSSSSIKGVYIPVEKGKMRLIRGKKEENKRNKMCGNINRFPARGIKQFSRQKNPIPRTEWESYRERRGVKGGREKSRSPHEGSERRSPQNRNDRSRGKERAQIVYFAAGGGNWMLKKGNPCGRSKSEKKVNAQGVPNFPAGKAHSRKK